MFVAVSIANLRTNALMDTGATGFAYIDFHLAQQIEAAIYPLPRRIQLIGFDGKSPTYVTHAAVFELEIRGHKEILAAFILPLPKWPLVLGLPWMEKHGIETFFEDHSITFGSKCMNHGHCQERITFHYHQNQDPIGAPVQTENQLDTTKIRALAPHVFLRECRRKEAQSFSMSLRDIDRYLEGDVREEIHYLRVGNAKMVIPKEADPKDYLPPEYLDYLDVFDRKRAEMLPPHRKEDHVIQLKPGTEPPSAKIYPMNREQLETLKTHLEKELDKGFIRTSKSPAAAPVLFVRKSNGDLRFCVDYRGLNEVTIKNRYPLPLVSETLDRLARAKFYTKIDIIAAFNKLRIQEGDEWKTAFQTRYGLFEYLVMPFGLCNGPASFQAYINKALHGYLDSFATAYMDDILIYSKNLKEHRQHVKKVLQRLREFGLQADISKCEFETQEVTYLGLIVSTSGIRMDPKKVLAISRWPTPRNVKDVQAFLGFANFYRRFISNFSKVVAPMTALTKKHTKFYWNDACHEAFMKIKDLFENGNILAHFDPNKKTVLETDASDYVVAAALSQYDDDGVLRPVAFMSKKMIPAECNYEIYDKELLAVVRAFEEWTPELESVDEPVNVRSDHKNLEYFMSTKKLNVRQARWSEFLSRFPFVIEYVPGRKNEKADALTRVSADKPQNDQDERVKHRMQQVIKPHQIDPSHAKEIQQNQDIVPSTHAFRPILQPPVVDLTPTEVEELENPGEEIDWEEAYRNDDTTKRIRKALQTRTRTDHTYELVNCRESDHGFTYNRRHFVPSTIVEPLLRHFHDSPMYGHRGSDALFGILRRCYYWPTMITDIRNYCHGCPSCARNNYTTRKPFGLLKPLDPPSQAFRHLTLDFIGPLPASQYRNQKHRYVLQVVDRLTKRVWLVPLEEIDAKSTAEAFVEYVFRFSGLPDTLVSDQGSAFLSTFWKNLCSRLSIDSKLSTAYHPETDGQTERANKTLNVYLRHYVNYLQNDWAKWLPIAEFNMNNHVNSSTGISAFFASFGHHPRMQFDAESQEVGNRDTAEFAKEMERVHDRCKNAIQTAQADQEKQANRRRQPAPILEVGQEVYLDVKNLKRERPSAKLDHLYAGPYKIEKMITPIVAQLAMPETRISNKFHISLLKPKVLSDFPSQKDDEPPPLRIHEDSTPEYEVERIEDSKYRYRKLHYLVKWTGWNELTWESFENVVGTANDVIREYHERNENKAGPEHYISSIEQALRVAMKTLDSRKCN